MKTKTIEKENRAAQQHRPTAAAPGELRRVPLKQIVASPFQARKTFQTPDWPGFVESVRLHGVVQPGVARELAAPTANGEKKVELVCGERRFRASVELGLPDMPLMIRALSDGEAQDIIAIENLQREGLNPLEEAQGYSDWISRLLKAGTAKTMRESVGYIESRVGKKRSWIYESLKLNKLAAPVKKAVGEGKLELTKAALVAGVAPAVQEKLMKQSQTGRYGHGEPLSAKQLRELIEEEYQRQLNQAPFTQDAALESGIGNSKTKHPLCTTCPYRSGNIEGFEGNPNVCTNVACYEAKTEAHVAAMLAAAHAGGARVLDPETYEKRSYDFKKTDETCYSDDKRRSYQTLAKVAKIEPLVTADKDGKMVEVFSPDDASKIKAANKIREYSGGSSASERAAQKKRQEKEKLFRGVAEKASAVILEKLVTEKGINEKLWGVIAAAAYAATDISVHDFVAKRRGLAKSINESRAALDKWFKDPKNQNWRSMAQMAVDLLVCAGWCGGGWQTTAWHKDFVAVCKLAGVNLEKLLKEGEKKTEQKPTKGTKRKAKKKGKASS